MSRITLTQWRHRDLVNRLPPEGTKTTLGFPPSQSDGQGLSALHRIDYLVYSAVLAATI